MLIRGMPTPLRRPPTTTALETSTPFADFRDSLVGSGHIDKAAIISAAGDSVWATSSGFTVRNPALNIINIRHEIPSPLPHRIPSSVC
jgi:hypothetical protein